MNWLDGIIGFISPEWGARREAWRQSLTEMRNYDAGNYDRGNANWRVLNQSAEFTDRYSRDNVRARARDLERNSDMMNSVIGAYKRNVIGGGYALQAKTGSDKTNEIIQTAWKKWCKKQNCDVTGTQSFTQMMRMCVKRKKVDGGILIIKRYTKDGYLPFKLQTFEVDELDNSQMLPKKKGNKVVGGIEMNEYNKPMGYWIRQYSVDGMALSNPVYVDAKDVIFLYTKHRPSQVREMSDMSPTITRIRDANEFMIAVSVKERIAACLSVFIKKQLPTTGIGRQNGSVPGPHQDYQGKSIAPGMIKELNAGDEIQVVNPTGQATDAASYIKLQQRLVGAGQGISYEATSRDMSESNYSSTRQGIIEDDMTYAEEKEMLMYTLFYSPTISTSGNTQAVNPLYRYKDSITVVEDPTINALCGGFGNVMPWWLLGAKDDTDFIEVDYLNGQEIPTIRRMETPGTLGFVWDIYLDWGISVMDYRGAIKNPGIEVKNPIELA